MRGRVRSKMDRAAVSISGIVEFSVCGRSITVNDRPRTNGLLDERHQVLIIAIGNLPNPDSSEPFGLEHFDGNDYARLGGVALASNRRNGGFPISEGKVGLIDFNFSVEKLPARSNHRASQPMQHGPSGLVTPQPKHALQPQCADSVLLIGDVPNGSEPDTKLGACLVEYRSRRCCSLMSACRANKSAATDSLDFI